MSDTETSIYNCYRAALRSMRKKAPGNRDSRVADRKQRALRIAAERFNVRIREVKDIVRTMDAARGIVHEHPENYLRELELNKAWGEALDNIGVAGPCQQCNTTDEEQSIHIRPNFRQLNAGGEAVFARHCYLCFVKVFGGYPDFDYDMFDYESIETSSAQA